MRCSWVLAVFASAVLAIPASAGTTADFNFTNQSPTCSPSCTDGGTQSTQGGNMVFSGYSQSSTVGGTQGGTVTNSVTMSAWQLPINASSSTDLSGAYAGYYSGYGVGICNSTLGPGCASPYHQVNNGNTAGDYEFMEFQFSTPVNISSIQLANFGMPNNAAANLSSTVFSSSSALTLTATTLANLNANDNPTNFNCTNATSSTCTGANGTTIVYSDPYNSAYGGNSPTVVDSLSLTDVKTLIIAAQIGQTNDFFKVQGITASNFAPTPEPATFGMFGLALAGIGLYRRKRGSRR